MKSGREHRVPLSEPAIAILQQMASIRVSKFVFPGQVVGKPLFSQTLLKLLSRIGRNDLTTHGFRATFRDWVAERTRFPAEVAEMALAHIVSDKVEAAYRRGLSLNVVAVPGSPVTIEADPVRLDEIVANLLATRATRSVPEITG